MTDKPSGFIWYELLTSDTAAAKAFYDRVVGWNMSELPGLGAEPYTVLNVGKRGVGGLMTIPADAAAGGLKPNWAGYIYVDDVDAMATKTQRLGGKVMRAPADIPGVGRFAVVADPEGAMLNLFKPSGSGEPKPTPAPGDIGWHELHAGEWPKAFAFYHDMFGWQKGDTVDMGPMGTYQLVAMGPGPGGAMFNSPAAAHARFWLFYFLVDDIDAAAKRLSDAGGTLTNGPHSVPTGDWIVHGRDPQGASFALVGPRR